MTSLSSLARQNLLLIFNQRDAEKRGIALRRLWVADGALSTGGGRFVGFGPVEKAIADILRRYPEFKFSQVGENDEIPGAVRVHWAFGASGIAPAVTGSDVILVEKTHIIALYRFLNGPEL